MQFAYTAGSGYWGLPAKTWEESVNVRVITHAAKVGSLCIFSVWYDASQSLFCDNRSRLHSGHFAYAASSAESQALLAFFESAENKAAITEMMQAQLDGTFDQWLQVVQESSNQEGEE